MNFLKKLLNRKPIEDNEIPKEKVFISLDDLFVKNFIAKGGKFLYCININTL